MATVLSGKSNSHQNASTDPAEILQVEMKNFINERTSSRLLENQKLSNKTWHMLL